MDLIDGVVGNEWQSFEDVEGASESIPSVFSGSFAKQESADDAVYLPDVLPALSLPTSKHSWNTNEEVASILMAFDQHDQWLHRRLTTRPFSGSIFLYNRKDIKFRQDGYSWKTGKKGKLREDHMKLKISGVSSIYGLYAHSAILSTFHRRCYWLLARPNLILVHYLNVIPKDDAIKLSLGPINSLSSNYSADANGASPSAPSSLLNRDAILQQLCPMFGLPFPLESCNKVSNLLGDESLSAMQQRYEKLIQLVDMALPAACKSSSNANVSNSASSNTANCREQVTSKFFETASPAYQVPTASMSPRPNASAGAASSSRLILPKSSVPDISYPSSMDCSLQQQHAMPPPPPMPSQSSSTAYNANNGRTSQKRPLDSTMFVDELQQLATASDGTTAYVVNSPQSYVFWNPSQLQSVQQPKQQQNSASSYFSFGDLASLTDSSSPRRVSCSGAQGPTAQSHGLLQSTFSAPSCVQQQPPPSSLSFSGGDESNFFSSFASSGNDPDMFGPLEFSPHVDELLQFSNNNVVDMPPMEQQLQVQLNQQPDYQPVQLRSQPPHDDGQAHYTGTLLTLADTPSMIRIKDIAPQSAFIRGGIKVLIAGRWPTSCHSITVSFGKTVVPATVLQPGLLKCYCPAVTQPGAVDLVVCCDGFVRSNPCTFYYRRQNMVNAEQLSPPRLATSSTNHLTDLTMAKLQLLELLQQLKDTMKPANQLSFGGVLRSCHQHTALQSTPASTTELLAVVILTEITSNLPPPEFCTQTIPVDANNWTLLHFAAALGYGLLAEYLLDLRIQSRLPPVVEQQADIEARDINGFTPLHVACSRGHPNAAMTLFRRAPHLIAALNNDGLNPIGTAAAAGHYDVVRVMQAHEDSYLNHLESASPAYPGEALTTSNSMVTFIGGNCSDDETINQNRVDADGTNPTAASWPYDATSQHMFDLANHIIAALPERIKQIPSPAYLQPLAPTIVAPLTSAVASSSDAFVVYRERSASHGSHYNASSSNNNNPPTNSTPLGDSGLSTPLSFSFEAPESNNSPQHPNGSGSSVRHRSPPPTPEQFNEYFNAPNFYLHHDFSHLTLSDDEQRRLYDAARVIQVAYRRYRENKLITAASPSRQSSNASGSRQQIQAAQDQVLGILVRQSHMLTPEPTKNLLLPTAGPSHQVNTGPSPVDISRSLSSEVDATAADDDRAAEIEQAALVIQAYYRRYKQFIAYRKMTEAATVIQSQFRSYSAQKRFRQSRDAARIIQNQYRMYRATNQRRGTCGPYRTANAGASGSRRRSGSASSSSSLTHGLAQGAVNMAMNPMPVVRPSGGGAIFTQPMNCPADMNDSFLKMGTWNTAQNTLQQQPLRPQQFHPQSQQPQQQQQQQQLTGHSSLSKCTEQVSQQQQVDSCLSNLNTKQSASSSQAGQPTCSDFYHQQPAQPRRP